MPKLKTHKGLKCRVRLTRTGKIVRKRAGKSHLMASKNGKKVRQLRNVAFVSKGETRNISRALAYRTN